MNSPADLDGSDAQDRYTSTVDQRCSAFKDHLGDALLILESLDLSSVNHLKQDEACKGLVNRLLSAFNTLPLPYIASQIDQVVKTGLEGIVANIARLALLEQSPQSVSSTIMRPPALPAIPAAVAIPKISERTNADLSQDPQTEATIHFLKGSPAAQLPQVIDGINRLLSRSEGSHSAQLSTRHSVDGCISLTCIPATGSFLSMMTIAAPFLSPFWTADAVIRIRWGGTVEYGIRIFESDGKTLFRDSFTTTRISDQIQRLYLDSYALEGGLASQIYSTYGVDLTLNGERRDRISVSETVAPGIYILSGTAARLQELVGKGEKHTGLTVWQEGLSKGILKEVYIRPFCLQY